MKKLIALLLACATVVSLVACGGAPKNNLPELQWEAPTYSFEQTLQNRQQAIFDTAMAYYNKNPYVQYGRQYITDVPYTAGGNQRGRTMAGNTPEEASADNTLYTVCSSFVFETLYNAFGYRLMNDAKNALTVSLSAGKCGDPKLVEKTYINTGKTAEDEAAIAELVANLQVGDIIVYYSNKHDSGHTVFYIGDYDGDGEGNIIESGGKKYNMETGADQVEEDGTIMIQTMEYNFKPTGKQYLGDMTRWAHLRPTNIDPTQYPITNAAMARMTYPGLTITRRVSGGWWGSVEEGGELTYTITLKNNGTKDFTAIPVMDRVAEGATITSVDGAAPVTRDPSWTVDLKAGEEKSLTYTVKVHAKAGTTLVSKGGSVAGIAMNTLYTTVQTFTPGEAIHHAGLQAAVAKDNKGVAFVNALYKGAYGIDPQVGDVKSYLESYFNSKEIPKSGTKKAFTAYTPKEVFPAGTMVLPMYYGGKKVLTTDNDRVYETLLKDLQKGDIILFAEDTTTPKIQTTAWIYDGECMITSEDGKAVQLDQPDVTPLLSYDFFILLRPSLTLKGSEQDVSSYPMPKEEEVVLHYTPVNEEFASKFAAVTLDDWGGQVNLASFTNYVYQKAGLKIKDKLTLTFLAMRDAVFVKGSDSNYSPKKLYSDEIHSGMLVEKWYGGKRASGRKLKETYKVSDFQPGDILSKYQIYKNAAGENKNYYWTGVYLGGGKFAVSILDQSLTKLEGGVDKIAFIADANADASILGDLGVNWYLFTVLRPAMIYTDINTEAAMEAPKEIVDTVVYTPLNADFSAAIAALTPDDFDKQTNLAQFGKAVYSAAGLGVSDALTSTVLKVREVLFEKNADGLYALMATPTDEMQAKILVPGYWGGKAMAGAESGCKTVYTAADFQVGDILCKHKTIKVDGKNTNNYWVGVCQGEGKFLVSVLDQSGGQILGEGKTTEIFTATGADAFGDVNAWNMFFVMRPARAYGDINTEAAK